MEITRTFDILDNYKIAYSGKEDALGAKEKGLWKKYSADDYINNAYYISFGLLSLGLKKGDRVATISNNRPEWNFLDMGILQIGAIHIPIYPTISESEYKYILNHAEVKYVFVSGKEQYRKIENIISEISSLKGIYAFELKVDGKCGSFN